MQSTDGSQAIYLLLKESPGLLSVTLRKTVYTLDLAVKLLPGNLTLLITALVGLQLLEFIQIGAVPVIGIGCDLLQVVEGLIQQGPIVIEIDGGAGV